MQTYGNAHSTRVYVPWQLKPNLTRTLKGSCMHTRANKFALILVIEPALTHAYLHAATSIITIAISTITHTNILQSPSSRRDFHTTNKPNASVFIQYIVHAHAKAERLAKEKAEAERLAKEKAQVTPFRECSVWRL